MKYLPIIGATIAIVCIADIAVAKTPAEIESIAKAVTVEINLLKAQSIGSGIIIERQGDLYTLITNRHVVCGKTRNCKTPPSGETYMVKLGDGQKYRVSATAVKILGNGLDLATVQFRSDRGYPVALVADPGSLKVGDVVYTSGYPATPPGFSFNTGSAIAVVDKRLTEDRGGYTAIYDAQTQPGMSGGGVFSTEGRLVAIHGQGERFRENTQPETMLSSSTNTAKEEVGSKIGYNRGIPVRWVVQGLAERGIRLGNRPVVNLRQTTAISAEEHFITGFNKLVEPGTDVAAGKRLAINAFSQAIRINPRYVSAYFMRAITYKQLREERRAVADYDRAIALAPRAAGFYNNRGNLKSVLNDPQGALADFDRAIALAPQDAYAYYNRGNLKRDKNDLKGALADYDRAIALAPKSKGYISRGNLKSALNDFTGALADYDRAIALAPQDAESYNNRAILKAAKLNDPKRALADFDRAIALDPNNADAYYNRAILKQDKLNNPKGALADFDRAIALVPKFTGYSNRGKLKFALNDFPGALADFDRAIALAPQDAKSYNHRGLLKANKLNDSQGALADYDRAITLDPKYAIAYYNRGDLKSNRNDPQGALADYDRAIAIDSKNDDFYTNRGILKAARLNDFQGGLADYNRAIALDPKSANAYASRGLLKYVKLGDRSGGIADMRQAAKLARVSGDDSILQAALKKLRDWGVGE